MQAGLKVILVHENDKTKGGCQFATLFVATPQELVNDGIYSDIAIALHTPPCRAVGLALMAQALGATKAGTMANAKRRLHSPRGSQSDANAVKVKVATYTVQ
eukprot:scaffold17230_cov62-Phaeocystis_antarctica.AAC.6